MTLGGWIIMILSVGTVSVLFFTCIYKVLTIEDSPERMHGMLIDTKDVED